jgi:hypothetical protein
VLRIEPNSKYVVVASFDKRKADNELSIECSVRNCKTDFAPGGAVIRIETGADDQLLDIAFVYPGATSPQQEGTGNDQRKLGLVLYALAIFKVEDFAEITAASGLRLARTSRPGDIPPEPDSSLLPNEL